MMLPALAAALAIIVQDHAAVRSAPHSNATELTALWPGDVVEVRGNQAEYLKVYSYRRERGGYLQSEAVRPITLSEGAAPELLAVLRFLRDSPGSEALGISYGAAYLRAVPTSALTAEPFDSIGRMAERLAETASGNSQLAGVAARLEVVEQFGVRMRSFENQGRLKICYDGELFRRVLSMTRATAEQRAQAALALTRPDCIDPNLGAVLRASLNDDHRELLDQIEDRGLTATTSARLHARRAVVWAAVVFQQARHGQAAGPTAQHALAELVAVRPNDLGDGRQAEYQDAVLRVSAIRWAAMPSVVPTGPLSINTVAGAPGQTCVELQERQPQRAMPALVRRCTYGIVWPASAQFLAQAPAVVLSVQPLESWRELWVFHQKEGKWTLDVLSPGAEDPDEGYVDFAGFAPGTRRLLIVREVREHARFRRRFEEHRLDDLVLVRQASTPELLRDFGRWQDIRWRQFTLALR